MNADGSFTGQPAPCGQIVDGEHYEDHDEEKERPILPRQSGMAGHPRHEFRNDDPEIGIAQQAEQIADGIVPGEAAHRPFEKIVAGRGTKHMAPDFGVLQALEQEGIRFVVMLDGDDRN